MKNFIKTLAAVFCCLMITTVFTSCEKSEDEMKSDLIGTWKESNNRFTNILIINENGSFSFQCQSTPNYTGEGHYRYERTSYSGVDGVKRIADLLILNYGSKASQTLEIKKLNSSTLELADFRNTFHLSK